MAETAVLVFQGRPSMKDLIIYDGTSAELSSDRLPKCYSAIAGVLLTISYKQLLLSSLLYPALDLTLFYGPFQRHLIHS